MAEFAQKRANSVITTLALGAKLIFATYLHKANFMQIRFFVLCMTKLIRQSWPEIAVGTVSIRNDNAQQRLKFVNFLTRKRKLHRNCVNDET